MSALPAWRIRWLGVCALDNFPEIAAEFDAVWVDQPGQTFGEALYRADALAIELMERAGVLPTRRSA